jgi:hypothetical protein
MGSCRCTSGRRSSKSEGDCTRKTVARGGMRTIVRGVLCRGSKRTPHIAIGRQQAHTDYTPAGPGSDRTPPRQREGINQLTNGRGLLLKAARGQRPEAGTIDKPTN